MNLPTENSGRRQSPTDAVIFMSMPGSGYYTQICNVRLKSSLQAGLYTTDEAERHTATVLAGHELESQPTQPPPTFWRLTTGQCRLTWTVTEAFCQERSQNAEHSPREGTALTPETVFTA